jgi:hypothetical protein
MLFIEFNQEFHSGENWIRYREVESREWHFIRLDIETLHLLISRFGIVGTIRFPDHKICADRPYTGREISVVYCGAKILLHCQNDTPFYLPHIEQNH